MLIYIVKKIFSFLLVLFLLSLLSVAIIYYSSNNLSYGNSFGDAYYSFYQLLFSNQLVLSSQFDLSFLNVLKLILIPTIELCLLAIIAAILIGFPIGIIAGLSNNSSMNHLIKFICLILYASPIIWIAILVMWISSTNWEYVNNIDEMPTVSNITLLDILFTPNIDKFNALINQLRYLLLSVSILIIQPCIVTIQLVSQSVSDIASRNFIKVANIRENSSFKVLFRHLLPNAIPSIIPQLTYNITTLFFSAITTEILLNRSGLGGWVFTAFHQHDYLIIAIAILSCGTLISLLRLLSEIFVAIFYPMQARSFYE